MRKGSKCANGNFSSATRTQQIRVQPPIELLLSTGPSTLNEKTCRFHPSSNFNHAVVMNKRVWTGVFLLNALSARVSDPVGVISLVWRVPPSAGGLLHEAVNYQGGIAKRGPYKLFTIGLNEAPGLQRRTFRLTMAAELYSLSAQQTVRAARTVRTTSQF